MAIAVAMSRGGEDGEYRASEKHVEQAFPQGQVERVEHLAVGLAELLQLVFLAQMEEGVDFLEFCPVGLRGEGVVDPCLQVVLTIFGRQVFGD